MCEFSSNVLYDISTKVKDGVITQELGKKHKSIKDELIFNFYKTIVDTQEKQMRQALISLGWTPPAGVLTDLEKFVGYCTFCGRKTGREELATNCDMTQPDNTNCPGQIIPIEI